MIDHRYSNLKQVLVDVEAVAALPSVVDRLGGRRVMILASGTLNRQTGAVKALRDALGERHRLTVDEIGAHSPRPNVMAALRQAREAEIDLLVSVGGGSVIDAGKAVQFCLDAGIHSDEELLAHGRFSDGSRGRLAGSWHPREGAWRVPHIALPTTLSAAEFSDNAGLSDPARGVKEGYRAEGLCPVAVLYDPVLSRHTPSWLTLSTAVRALDHAVEGYCSPDAHPYLQAHYLHALRLFFRALPDIHADPDDVQARSLAQQACWLSGCALGRVRHGASHGIGYILGAAHGVPHGHTSCVMLPAVLEWNAPVDARRQAELAGAAGGDGGLAWQLRTLLRSLDLPVCLEEVGVEASSLDAVAKAAARHPVVRSNPRPIKGADDVREILELARAPDSGICQ
ncbi:MAG: iron-containing alcohol dehydrogenase [Pseudomonadota bacterium]